MNDRLVYEALEVKEKLNAALRQDNEVKSKLITAQRVRITAMRAVLEAARNVREVSPELTHHHSCAARHSDVECSCEDGQCMAALYAALAELEEEL